MKIIALIAGAFFEIFIIYRFLNSFWENKKIRRLYYIFTIILISIYHSFISLYFTGLKTTIFAFFTCYLLNQLFNSKQYVKILSSILITVINVSGELLFGGLFMLFSNKLHSEVNTTPEGYALGILISKFFSFIIIIIICTKSSKLEINYIKIKDRLILSILPITTLLVCIFSFQTIYLVKDNIQKTIYIFLNLLLIISNIITFEVIINQNKLAKSDYELQLVKNTVNEQERHYNELQKYQEEIRTLHHDMRNTYIGVMAAVESGKTNDVLEKLKSDLDYLNSSSRFINTGHIAIDTILETKWKVCAEHNISHNISFSYKCNLFVNEIELAIIIGNILDNAINASIVLTKSPKEIWGTIVSDKNNIIITIKNYSENQISTKIKKENCQIHGFGLKNVKHIAKKYNGHTKFTYENGIFTSFIILENCNN